MIPLHSKALTSTLPKIENEKVFRLSSNRNMPQPLRKTEIFLLDGRTPPSGFWGYIAFGDQNPEVENHDLPVMRLNADMTYLRDGDVIWISNDSLRVRVLYRALSPHNSLLLTERCN